jgi:hypothetical protein
VRLTRTAPFFHPADLVLRGSKRSTRVNTEWRVKRFRPGRPDARQMRESLQSQAELLRCEPRPRGMTYSSPAFNGIRWPYVFRSRGPPAFAGGGIGLPPESGSVYSLKSTSCGARSIRSASLIDALERRPRQLPYQKAKEIKAEIHTLEIMPDHVHMFVEGDPTTTTFEKSFPGSSRICPSNSRKG